MSIGFKSRLRIRRTKKNINVKERSRSGGQYTEANVTGLTNLTPTYEQQTASEQATEGGGQVSITDFFWFARLSTGLLPAIEYGHLLVDQDDATRYEVMETDDQGGQGNILKVGCQRAEG